MQKDKSRLAHQMEASFKSINAEEEEIKQSVLNAYRRDAMRAIPFFESQGIRDIKDMPAAIQSYIDKLTADKAKPSTISTYFYALAKGLNASGHFPQEKNKRGAHIPAIRASKYNFPERRGGYGNVTRGRADKAPEELRPCQRREASPRLYDLAKVLGIRKAEYRNLIGASLKRDESGKWCVEVLGKGNKLHKQYIPSMQLEFVKSYFVNIGKNEYVFSKKEIAKAHDLNLHKLRRENAQELYEEVKSELESNPKAFKRLYNELKYRIDTENNNRKISWEQENEKRIANGEKPKADYKRVLLPSKEEMKKPLVLRKGPRQGAIRKGKDTTLNRLAAYYVSVFALSHWTTNSFTRYYYT